ncbi:unnamed protein product [Periconia digitata]|uniref:Uncharacterized protein n=1 Tax=Periconia digitata TaxID=1303443 RepID=A0A9W4ULG5_9PLEO|nr:unnamed protein product [Periconia digitata]
MKEGVQGAVSATTFRPTTFHRQCNRQYAKPFRCPPPTREPWFPAPCPPHKPTISLPSHAMLKPFPSNAPPKGIFPF